MNLAEIPVEDLLAVAPFRADRDVRYYLDGIYAEPDLSGGAFLVATNGHIMAATRSPEAVVTAPCILRWSKMLNAAAGRAMRSGANARLVVETERGCARIVNPIDFHIEAGAATIDGKYPEWRRIIPQELAPGLPGLYAPKYLNLILSIRFPRALSREHGVKFFHDAKAPTAEEAKVVARWSGLRDLIAVLMPMRERVAVNVLPDWAVRPAPAETPREKAA